MKKLPINTESTDGLTVEDLKRILANPYYCMTIDESMTYEHQPLITEELWIKAAANSIKENGAEDFLRNLLENLKGNYV